jgi:ribosome-binding protein aMBF1 (putative translation factor)
VHPSRSKDLYAAFVYQENPENADGGSGNCADANERGKRMATHQKIVKKLMKRPGVKAEVERIEREEGVLLDALLKARHSAGLTQADVAERMGTQAPAVARLERALATGKHSPSIATLRKYVDACGKKLVLRVA